MTTHILPPERWAMDPGPYAGLVSAYADEIGGVGYDAYTVNCLVAAARHLCAWTHLSERMLAGPADGLVEDFADHDCHCGGVRRGGPRSPRYLFRVERFVRFLVAEGVLATVPSRRSRCAPCRALSRLVAPASRAVRDHDTEPRQEATSASACHRRRSGRVDANHPADRDPGPARTRWPQWPEADRHRVALLAALSRGHGVGAIPDWSRRCLPSPTGKAIICRAA